MRLQKTLPRPYYVGVNLRADEYERIAADAEKFGVSKAEALRRNCPEFFTESVKRGGRIPGVSPWKRTG
jgi:hypothetical protein